MPILHPNVMYLFSIHPANVHKYIRATDTAVGKTDLTPFSQEPVWSRPIELMSLRNKEKNRHISFQGNNKACVIASQIVAREMGNYIPFFILYCSNAIRK